MDDYEYRPEVTLDPELQQQLDIDDHFYLYLIDDDELTFDDDIPYRPLKF